MKSIFSAHRKLRKGLKSLAVSACFICIDVSEIRFAEGPFYISTYNEAFHWTHVCFKNRHSYINLSEQCA